MNRFIEKYELLENISNRKIKKFELEFRPGINVIVGENGSGKSTLLKLLNDAEFVHLHHIKQRIHISEYTKNIGVDTMMFDTEKDNPRFKDIQYAEGCIGGILASHFISHGQTLFPILEGIKTFKDKICFIDEPESGISLSNQAKLWKSFEIAAENGCQLIISTHSFIFIKNALMVFDLDSKKWINSYDYLPKI